MTDGHLSSDHCARSYTAPRRISHATRSFQGTAAGIRSVPGLRELDLQALPDGDVLVQVAYSSLNYKDGLAVTGKGKVLRSYPIVPGIDLSGTVLESGTKAFRPGDRVLVTGWGIGEQYWGGYAELARVRSEWVLPLPAGLDEKQAMVLGTAGLTAALGVLALGARGLKTDQLPVLVTGASGGVGSIAVALLARRGLEFTASTGRDPGYPLMLGAQQVIDRSELVPSPRPLESERWSGAVDTVGGTTLAAVLRALARGAGVAVCGNAGGAELETTVFPFILRGSRDAGYRLGALPGRYSTRGVGVARP